MAKVSVNEVFDSKNEIVAAISKAIGEAGRVSKGNTNQFDPAKYKFASIDDFLKETSRICADNGLIVIQDQPMVSEVQNKKTRDGETVWRYFVFSFTVWHVSGQSMGPFTRDVSVQYTGAQTYGSAQSYALKQFMRSLFQIATGDNDDPDHVAKVDVIPDSIVLVARSPTTVEGLEAPTLHEQKVSAVDLSDDSIRALAMPHFEGCLPTVVDDWVLLLCKKPLAKLGPAVRIKLLEGLKKPIDKWSKDNQSARDAAIATNAVPF